MKWPRRCTRSTRSHSSDDIVKIMRSRRTPALYARMPSPPKEPRAWASIASPVAHSPTSPSQTTAWPPAPVISSATSRTAGPGRSFRTSLAPAAASAMASARPRPLPAPVTIAVLPARVSPWVMLDHSFFALSCRRALGRPSVPGPGQDPAVGHELGARAIGRVIRGEERDEPRHLDRLAEPAERESLDVPLAALGVHALGCLEDHPRENPAWVHRVHPDAEPGEFLGRRVRHATDAECSGGAGPGICRAG